MNTRVREGRTALAITVFLIATLTVPAVFLGSSRSAAQQAQQPSPTGTGPAIQLYNPSDYNAKPQMSDKDTSDADNALEYHFAAAVTNAPANAYVEFFLIQGSEQFNLGCASVNTPSNCQGRFTGTLGAVELIRDIPDHFTEGSSTTGEATGDATVRAILFANDGQTEVARDQQSVLLNQKDRPANDSTPSGEADPVRTAETVEILYPRHGGSFGVYRRPSGVAVGVVDVEWSSGTDGVRVFYSTAPPDADPDWKTCGTETTAASTSAASAQDGVRCTLQDNDQPESITGIAAVARDNESAVPNDPNPVAVDNSGDGHRVAGYTQRPGIVSVSDGAVAAGGIPGCSGLLVAQVLDQTTDARPIAGINVDVHAQGPTDNLAFNTHAGEQSDTNQSNPDVSQAPQNHPTESGRRCSNSELSGTQGVHAVGGGPDRKHIESANGSDDDGRFVYKLWSDAQGGTRVTAWADSTDDDRFCPDEVSGSGVVTWGDTGPAAPPADGPEPQPCPNPSPSGSGSPSSGGSSTSPSTSPTTGTTSPSTSPTGSASPSGSASASTTPSSTATTTTPSSTGTTGGTTGGGTTTGEGTTGAGQAATSISIEASKPRKTFGKTFTLSGSVTSENQACTSFVDVEILRDVIGGNDDFTTVGQTRTDADGAYVITLDADRSATYIAQTAETAACDDATSEAEPVLVRVKVFLKLSQEKIRKGQRVRLKIRTAPCPETARDKVLLFRAIEGKYGKTGKKRSDANCRATFTRRPRSHAVFQGRWPKQTPEFLAGRTRPKAVRVVPRRG